MSEELKKDLTCTMCNEIKETYSQIVYSRGSRVCLDCKKLTKTADDRVFDNDWYSAHRNPWNKSLGQEPSDE